MSDHVDFRIVKQHTYEDGRWKFDSRGGWDEIDRLVFAYCDRTGRVNPNATTLYYVACCTASYRCPARAYVRKGYVQDHVRDLLDNATTGE